MTLPSGDPQALAQAGVDLLRRYHHMVIGTADLQGQPWVVPVSYQISDDGGLTWRSRIDTRHSQNLNANPKMSATLYEVGDHGEISLFLEGSVRASEPIDGFSNYSFHIARVWMNDDTHTKYPVDRELLLSSL